MSQGAAQRFISGALALPAAYLMAKSGHPVLALLSLTATVALAQVPDVDRQSRFIPHRLTHSLLFVAGSAVALGCAGWLLGSEYAIYSGIGAAETVRVSSLELAVLGFTIGGQAFTGHLLADFLTRADITPLWPVKSSGVSTNGQQLIDPRQNEGRYVVGTVALAVVVTASMMMLI